jgi:hypothetical protein
MLYYIGQPNGGLMHIPHNCLMIEIEDGIVVEVKEDHMQTPKDYQKTAVPLC